MTTSIDKDLIRPLLDYNPGGWRDQAACKDMDTDLFFTDTGDGGQDLDKMHIALEACRNCPVVTECLKFGQSNDLRHGIYGGHRRTRRGQWISLI